MQLLIVWSVCFINHNRVCAGWGVDSSISPEVKWYPQWVFNCWETDSDSNIADSCL